MKKVNLLSRAEMEKVRGGNIVAPGGEPGGCRAGITCWPSGWGSSGYCGSVVRCQCEQKDGSGKVVKTVDHAGCN